MTERVKQYRVNAEKCFELAKRFSDPKSKHSLLVIANAWLMLAAQRAKNIECEKCGFISEPENAQSAHKRA